MWQGTWRDIHDYFTNDIKYPNSEEAKKLIKKAKQLQGIVKLMNVRGDGYCLLNAVNAVRSQRIMMNELVDFFHIIREGLEQHIQRDCEADIENIKRGQIVNDLSESWIPVISMHIERAIVLLTSDECRIFNAQFDGNALMLFHYSNHFYSATSNQSIKDVAFWNKYYNGFAFKV